MEDITDSDYKHPKTVFKYFEVKNLGEYHDLYVQSDTLLLADEFDSIRNMCLTMDELDPAKFLSATGLAWQAALKKTKEKLDLLTGISMLLMAEKGIRGGICNAIYWYTEAINKIWMIMMKIKNHHILFLERWIICMVVQCLKNFL